MKRKDLPKERNPFVQHLIKKKQGAHGKSAKATRRDEKASLKKEIFVKVLNFYKDFY